MKSGRLIILLFVVFAGLTNFSMAQEPGSAKKHPTHSEVNQRLLDLNRRIRNKEENREMSRRLAGNLRRQGQQIREEERKMASRHGGRITKHEQNRLNHQENHLSRKIHRA